MTRIVTAKLKKHQTDDGGFEVWGHVPLGKEYRIDLDRAATFTLYNRDKQFEHRKVMVPDLDYPGLTNDLPLIGWLPLEVLEVPLEQV